jgi:hypothetical protein
LILGVLLGSSGLAILPGEITNAIDPLIVVGASWIAFTAAIDWVEDFRNSQATAVVREGLTTMLGFAGFAAALFLVGTCILEEEAKASAYLAAVAAWIGLASPPSRRRLRQWPLVKLGAWRAGGFAVVFAGIVAHQFISTDFQFASGELVLLWAVVLIASVILGATLGGLQRIELGSSLQWSPFVGSSLLLAGVSARSGLSPILALMAFGGAFACTQRELVSVRAQVVETTPAVLAPFLVLIGLKVDLRLNLREAGVVVLLAAGIQGFGFLRHIFRVRVGRKAGVQAQGSDRLRDSNTMARESVYASGGLELSALAVLPCTPFHEWSPLLLLVAALNCVLDDAANYVGRFSNDRENFDSDKARVHS